MGKKKTKTVDISDERRDLIDVVREEIYAMGTTDPVASRLLNSGDVQIWKYDDSDPDTLAQISMAPQALARDVFTTDVDKNGNLCLKVNADWLESTLDKQNTVPGWDGLAMKVFAEAEKLIMRHDRRRPDKNNPDSKRMDLFRDASQLVSNEAMFRYFGFDRTAVDPYKPHNKIPEALFKPNDDGEVYRGNMMVESVFRYLCEIVPPDPNDDNNGDDDGDGSGDNEGDNEGDGQSVGGEGTVDSDGLDKLMQSVAQSSTNQELQEHTDKQQQASKEAGTGDSTMKKEYDHRNRPRKRKWQEIIQVWSQNILKSREESSWIRNPYHMAHFCDMVDARIPATVSQEVNDKGKVSVAFFADTSGSCVEYWDRFAAAALSLPEDVFDLHLFAFDTRVYRVDRNKFKFVGGGGTYFHIISDAVNELTQQIGMYPHVFVISDGYGDRLEVPRHIPEGQAAKWNWFLTEHSTDNCIPKGSRIWKLENYE